MFLNVLSAATDTVQAEPVQWALWQILLTACAAIVTVSGAAGVLWWLVWPRIRDGIEQIAEQVHETHKSVTVNGGRNSPPTLLDKVGDLGDKFEQLNRVVGAQAAHNAELADRVDEVHDIAAETRDALRRHEKAGEQYLGRVQLVMRTQGIELPPATSDRPDDEE